MRLIGHLPTELSARTFGDYAYAEGIDTRIEHEKDSGWAIWVSDEDQIEKANNLLRAYSQAPADPKYRAATKVAAEKRAEEEKSRQAFQKRFRDAGTVFHPLAAYGLGPVTLSLILASIAVFLLTRFGKDMENALFLFMSLPAVLHGQVWRLVTPIFLHFSVLHILFNVLWLRDLGGMIEYHLGSLRLLLYALVIAICSNLGQYFFGGAGFGGMSGVVYGLLGYIWMRGKFDPGSGLFLHPTTVMMMIAWFFLCLTGVMGPVANAAHAAGLGVGIIWGYLASQR